MSIAMLMTVGLQVATGVALAASAGLRAFLPLLVVGLAGRLELIPVAERFEWLTSTAALVVLGVAVVAELVADKVPLVDHLLDLVATVVRPLAGAVAMAAPLVSFDPLATLAVGIVVGGSVAGGVHVAKSQARTVSTASTGGAANPLISLAEDVLALGWSVVAVLVPALAVVVAVAVAWWLARKLSRGRRRPSPLSPAVDGSTR